MTDANRCGLMGAHPCLRRSLPRRMLCGGIDVAQAEAELTTMRRKVRHAQRNAEAESKKLSDLQASQARPAR